jgi:hypothetical protein
VDSYSDGVRILMNEAQRAAIEKARERLTALKVRL